MGSEFINLKEYILSVIDSLICKPGRIFFWGVNSHHNSELLIPGVNKSIVEISDLLSRVYFYPKMNKSGYFDYKVHKHVVYPRIKGDSISVCFSDLFGDADIELYLDAYGYDSELFNIDFGRYESDIFIMRIIMGLPESEDKIEELVEDSRGGDQLWWFPVPCRLFSSNGEMEAMKGSPLYMKRLNNVLGELIGFTEEWLDKIKNEIQSDLRL